MRFLLFLASLVITIEIAYGVNRTSFKSCEQSSFCRRCRKLQPGTSKFQLVDGTYVGSANYLTVDLINKENDHLFALKLSGIKSNTFRMEIDEKQPLSPRYRVEDALKSDPILEAITVTGSVSSDLTVVSGSNKVVLKAVPFRVDFYSNNVLVMSANAKGLMRFEHLRTKGTTGTGIEDLEPDSWEETFNYFVDSKPKGPEAIALDFSFPQSNVLFGIPEHSESFALKSTLSGDPYRLYNVDIPFYEVDSGMSQYGAVPLLYGHGVNRTAAVFWQNSAETWIEIYNSTQTDPLTANFMSESGIIDTFILMGPKPNDAFKQYTDLTGVTKLPQLYNLAYHQCRWNYMSEDDVYNVSTNFDVHDIPMDTMWLDIEYTNGKRYFTWDPVTFANPLQMIKNLTDLGRHLTVIVDIHIKRDDSYKVHADCTRLNYYTKNKDMQDYIGECWPGLSSYPDVFNPDVRQYLSSQYSLANFPGTTEDVMIWNDMNEPSVFIGPETSMPRDNIHYGGWEHRDVHNLFGHMQLRSTYQGLGDRSQWKQRPFVLTRSHFAGSQRYSAIWTGDNTGDWPYLQVAIKTCLTQAVSGFSFCGGDVGGFFGNPEEELVERWYQAAAFQPFYRGHANMDTERREPWLFKESTKLIIRDAIRKRYSYLPFWYTMFFEHERNGLPVMRPLLSQYPEDAAAFAMDDQYLLSDALLVHPVAAAGVQAVNVYFPNDLWYDIDDYLMIERTGYTMIPVDSHKTPVYQRGGTIIAKKEPIRRASTLMKEDPYTLIVCVNRQKSAIGTLYIDDEKSFDYKNGKYIYRQFTFANSSLTSAKIDVNATYSSLTWLERVDIVGLQLDWDLKSVNVKTSSKSFDVAVSIQRGVISIKNPGVLMAEDWSISLNGASTLVVAIFWQLIVVLYVTLFA